MAQLTGYLCDVCEKFSVDRQGWLKVQTAADRDAKGFDICSNTCLIKLGQRRRAEMNEKPTRQRHFVTGEFKNEVMKYYTDHTAGETADKFGISTNMVYKYATDLGISKNERSATSS